MIRRFPLPLFLSCALLCTTITSQGIVKVSELETRFGPLRGQMELGNQTVLLFPGAKVKVSHETGLAEIETIQSGILVKQNSAPRSFPDLQSIRRKINRLPAHEQVRYWKLHQIRYPESNVSSELNAALDLMESIRKDSIEMQKPEPPESYVENDSQRRYRRSSGLLLPGYGYSSNYRYRRARHKDTQIELDRVNRERAPVESWITPMSLADHARSDALAKVSGARSAILGNTR
jgi:hypothetical protein